MSRKRGRIVLVGVVGLDISRADFFAKELTFQVSCSYGPGRYDANYEQKGEDYPIGFVRWTEQRNFEAILNAISEKRINVKNLITDRIPLAEYQSIYGDMASSKSIASILEYPSKEKEPEVVIPISNKNFEGQKGIIGIIGAGNFTSAMILPSLKKCNAAIKHIASSGGLTGTTMARKYEIANSTSDYKTILEDKAVDLVMITTRHNSHANLVCEVLKANKHVFVEKPLALNFEQIENVIQEYESSSKTVTVGFNRRFAPLATKMKKLLGNSNTPMNVIATMNAGFIPQDVWVHDMEIGGGRIIGEACHFIDLCTFFTEGKVISVCMNAMGVNPSENTDNGSILLKYDNGSTAVINYFSNGSKAYSKERVEIYQQERTLVLDNWRKLRGYGFAGFRSLKTRQDKGHANQFKMLVESVKNSGDPIISMAEIVNTSKASIAAVESLKKGVWVSVS